MKSLENEINKNLNARKYDKVLDLLEDDKSLSPYFYTLRGSCIQLCENSKYTLADAEKFLLRAIEIDPKHLRAYIELGYFYLTKLRDKKKAEHYLLVAKQILKESLVETLIGQFQLHMTGSHVIDPIALLDEFDDAVLEDKDFSGLLDAIDAESKE